ncbi:hypothetical protein [Streptomyces sp. DSM 41033]|uniref:hypothetical protein n=1 Tax=Streptomyces sp. DSM 41033 TaxID=3448655 RepID=UPI0040403F1A
MDVGSVLGGVGRAAAGIGRLVWGAITAPTTGTEDDARFEIDRLAEKIEDEVPEDLREQAWGLVLDALRQTPWEIEQLIEEHPEPRDHQAEEPTTKR